MNLNDILKANGVADEAIGKILAAMKENKIFTAAEENLDIRYGKLKNDFDNLKKDTAGFGELQGKAAGFEKELGELKAANEKLTQELQKTKLEAEIKVNLLSEGCLDVDYAAFKLREKGELTLDENGKIKGWEDALSGLKTQIPAQFESAKTKQVMENRLPNTDNNRDMLTRESILKMPYNERMKVYNENPDGYHAAMGK